ncbi:DUF536 domain-containing protein [Latilactobacillus sakei]|uniref:DUF536 domain-containing protein n=1 Tax=Latilactobacillus sakei TaxID=1599 RepID=UPI000C18A750|nr:DUF536 domain-containing protein [Latilactobacillus sakei]AWZ43512.1 DUF536 domain-containing protein [Latilactobacillus sakei]AWZ45424.1 DUF536 domain-containing protein [Latilactobacillus sakei]PKX61035.1 DUF536 domain-containing protein [Latilactobacillus sakei]PKX70373.1 DUF536 domain-containing protein [Latilactobacillus sakei]
MSKTIRELSEELGVSKTAITKFLTPERRKLFAKKIDNRLSISDKGVSIIRQHFLSKSKTKIDNRIENKSTVVDFKNHDFDFNNELLSTLKNELAEKNKQIERLQKSIEQQNILIDQQQKLTLQANQKIENIESNLEISEPQDQKKESLTSKKDDPITNKKSKKHWWQF